MDLDIAPMTDAVNLRDELKAVGIEEILVQLDRELIGLKPVKTRIREIASLLLIERIRKRMGLASEAPTLPVVTNACTCGCAVGGTSAGSGRSMWPAIS